MTKRIAQPSRFKQGEFAHVRMSYMMEESESYEACLKPEYWSAVSYQMAADPVNRRPDQAGGIIEVRREDGAFYAELYIVAASKSELVVKELRFVPIHTAKLAWKNAGDSDHAIRWNLAKKEHEVMRLSDNTVVAGFANKDDAIAHMNGL